MQAGLSRNALVQTALALADEAGLEAVTMRQLAEVHDVTPMALYRYFFDKDRILDALAEQLLTNVVIPEPTGRPWHEQVTDLLGAFVVSLRAHPNAAILVLSRVLQSESGLAVTDRMLALLAEGGFAVDVAAETASQALCSLVTLVVTEPGRALGGDVEAQDAEIRVKKATLSSLDPRRYGHVVAAADALARCASEEVYYERGIRMIVAGIRGSQALREKGARAAKKSTAVPAKARVTQSRSGKSRAR